MKVFTVPALLAAALFSAVVVIPFLPTAKSPRVFFALEARVASSVEGVVKIYYDTGKGYSELASTQHALVRTDRPRRYRFPLSPAAYRAIRFDPIDRAGTVTLEGPIRIISDAG